MDVEEGTGRTAKGRARPSDPSGPKAIMCPVAAVVAPTTFLSSCFGHRVTRTWVLPGLILAVGVAASTAFLVIGVHAANQDVLNSFQRNFEASVRDLQETWYDYISAGLWLHEASRTAAGAGGPGSIADSRQAFREIYEHVTYSGGDASGGRVLDLQAVAFAPNVSNEDRPAYEAEATSFYRQYPSVKYNGFQGLEPRGNALALQARSNQSYYYPIQYIEPIEGNEAFVGFDLLSCQYEATFQALATWTPTVTKRMKIETNETDPNSYSVILLHPGAPLKTELDLQPQVFTLVFVGISSLLNQSASRRSMAQADVYLYDATNTSTPSFLGAARAHSHEYIHFFNETSYSSLKGRRLFQEQTINVGNRLWIMAAVPIDGSDVPSLAYVILGASLILAACVGIAVGVHASARRSDRYGALKSAAEAEKAATKAERSLGDFVAHEVRNPIAAAISACTFVKAAVNEDGPLLDPKTREATREDVDIVYNSLQYVNDLLRNMLDIHRASDKQLHVTLESTDLLRDVLEPVDSMLYRRNGRFEVRVDCPKDLYVTTDRLRLKQIVLNLALNSSKFIDGEGCYIKLGAKVVGGMVQLTVEDTGPGVPLHKRNRLFSKFQSSLDNLNQGTGVGLHLCKVLANLLGAEIWLDESYDSGLPGRPGAKFVISLGQPPNHHHDADCVADLGGSEGETVNTQQSSDDGGETTTRTIPEALSVLFVDDDLVLRKLFARTIRSVLPGWTVREAANGETAIRLVEESKKDDGPSHDLIFVDQYMASYDKQLLGTETVTALRSMGVSCRICGLSANDAEREFMEAGADAFMFKPFPCERRALLDELHRILYGQEASRRSDS